MELGKRGMGKGKGKEGKMRVSGEGMRWEGNREVDGDGFVNH